MLYSKLLIIRYKLAFKLLKQTGVCTCHVSISTYKGNLNVEPMPLSDNSDFKAFLEKDDRFSLSPLEGVK